ncbi:MAG: 2-hydroxyacid dehydrogenase [Geminicoccaceae bacterium]
MQTKKPTVYVTRRLPADVTNRLVGDYDARLNEDDHLPSNDEIESGVEGADAIITTSNEPFRKERIDALPSSIKIITTFSVGFEHIDIQAAKDRGIQVGNTPDVLTEATADIAMLCLLGAARRAHEAASLLREGRWVGWHTTQLVGMELKGAAVGIVGMGRIGRAFARRARGFGLTIHYHNRTQLREELAEGALYYGSVDELLPKVDILSLHCPASPATTDMVNAKSLASMRPGSILVNTARGALVDEAALIDALKNGHLAAAGLDVFKNEPNVNREILALDNVFALPHIGSATIHTRNQMGFCCLDNLDACFAGRPIPHPVT